MTKPRDEHGPGRRRAALVFAGVVALGVVLYSANVRDNPPGFYIDESSVSYNAHLIATVGRDEHGTSWPLFFRAFGDYKNPTYVYLLAAVFRVTGPSILAARLLSAALGVAAALVLGLLAARVSKRREAGALVALSALLTPWLFELSRVVVEVAMYPLAVALFLLCAHRAASKARLSWGDAAGLAATLALLTYSYSVGRLLGPLLALGLAFFAKRERPLDVPRVWLLYALSLVPLFVYARLHPGALTGRFQVITYLTGQLTYAEIVWEFLKHFSANLDVWRMLVTGDPNENQIASIYGVGLVLAATFALAFAGECLVLWRGAREERRWWWFVLYGLAASVVPASLTNEHFHMLRLSAMPVFLLVLTVPASSWLLGGGSPDASKRRRGALLVLVLLTLAQGAVFQWQYHSNARAPRRVHLFDHDYPEKILAPALASTQRPIYLADALSVPGYIQAYWHATLRGVPTGDFVLLAPDASPPTNALVISTEESCPRCRVISQRDPYKLYVAERPPQARAALPAEGFRAGISVSALPASVRAGEKATFRVVVKNLGPSVWLARERSGGKFQVSLGNHWLDAQGRTLTNDDGRAAVLRDLGPGEETELSLVVNAPRQPGEYLLELDLLQEGVSWFGLKGSKTTRLPVRVD